MTEVAARHNEGKPQLHYWQLFPRTAELFARVMEYGATKYEYMNFAKGGKPDQEYLDAAARHRDKGYMRYYWDGDEDHLYDDESGCLHHGHELFNLFMLIEENLKHLPVRRKKDVSD